MNKFFKSFILFLLGCVCLEVSAQADAKLPIDPAVRIGKLENGLTYYIRHNDYPKGQAEFYIAQKVGSIVEEENQRGLAHFLEHMCFNGTKSFPGNKLIEWCESVGIRFGSNLNAYTSIEQTVYNISSVPTARESVQDSCLLILHDWANDLLLDESEIDAERGVIHEEWRSQMAPTQRILEKILPTIYPNSRYGHRLPIGTMEVVDNFPYQALRDYYEKWYRPDLQGIMIVGDIDVDAIEAKVKKIFSDIEMPENAAARPTFEVADNKEPIIALGTDKEQSYPITYIMFKNNAIKPEQKETISYYVRNYMLGMAGSMFAGRYSEMASKPEAPFAQASGSYGTFLLSNPKAAFNAVAVAKTDIKQSIEAVYRETLRVKRHGFTATEYERARIEYLSRLEKAYNNRKQIPSSSYVNEYVDHFLDNEPTPGIEFEYPTMSAIAKQIPVEAINKLVQDLIHPDSNVVVVGLYPDREGLAIPTAEEISAIMKTVDAENIEAYVDNVKQDPLIAQLPAKGSIVKESELKEFGAKQWTLSNGVKVIFKKTDFKEEEVIFSATAKGGTTAFPDDDLNSLLAAGIVTNQYSLGSFTSTDLQKYMAGKQASMSFGYGNYSRGMSGSSTPKDLKYLMELIYMGFTAYGIDAQEFDAAISTSALMLEQQSSTPQYVFQKRRSEALYTQPRNTTMTPDMIRSAKREYIVDMVKTMYSNAADFTFQFIGNFDEANLRELVEQYIATLPADPSKVTKKIKLAGLGRTRGSFQKDFYHKMEVPQVYTSIGYVGDAKYNLKNAISASMIGQIMSTRLLESVREKEGATYSIGASCGISANSDDTFLFQTSFPMKPEKKEIVLDIVKKEFKAMAEEITAEEINKTREFITKNYQEIIKKNGTWLRAINNYLMTGVNTMDRYEETLNSITAKDLTKLVKSIIKQNNLSVIFLNPEVEGETK